MVKLSQICTHENYK